MDTPNHPPSSQIKRLDASVVNRIAAGEIVDRPASIVKELIENSLDAGSTTIEIAITNGGLSNILIIDNGQGISSSDLLLCTERHATSKLAPTDDTFNVATYGFRGEALASISAVSRTTISSRQIDSEHGWKLIHPIGKIQQSSDGTIASHSQVITHDDLIPISMSVGTQVQVQELFFNVPARQKFLRSGAQEASAVLNVIRQLACVNSACEFRVVHNNRQTLHVTPTTFEESMTPSRMASVFHRDLATRSLSVNRTGHDGTMSLSGILGLPGWNHQRGMIQQLFVNTRAIRSRSLTGMIRAAYGDRLPNGRHPSWILHLNIHPSWLDINVHPMKTEIRLFGATRVNQFIRQTIKETLDAAQLENAPQTMLSDHITKLSSPSKAFRSLATNQTTHRSPPHKPASRFRFDSPIFDSSIDEPYTSDASIVLNDSHSLSTDQFESHEQTQKTLTPPTHNPETDNPQQPESQTPSFLKNDKQSQKQPPQRVPDMKVLGMIDNTFIVLASEDQLDIIDFHAVHERLLYEQAKRALTQYERLPAQRLLLPQPIELAPADRETVWNQRTGFARYGFDLERRNQDLSLVSIPELFAKADPLDLFADLLKDVLSDHRWQETADAIDTRINRLASTTACHRARRSGDTLQDQEAQLLVDFIHTHPAAGQCNHGRTAFVSLDRKGLRKLFGR